MDNIAPSRFVGVDVLALAWAHHPCWRRRMGRPAFGDGPSYYRQTDLLGPGIFSVIQSDNAFHGDSATLGSLVQNETSDD
jgi:hypothetical protein